MFTRRRFIASAASVLVVTPAYAQTDTPFVLPPEFEPQYVRVKGDYAPGQILIVPQTHFLYLITDKNKAIRYAVGVGKAGLDFQGSAIIQVKKEWPSWRPTDEMIERSPQNYLRYKDGMPAARQTRLAHARSTCSRTGMTRSIESTEPPNPNRLADRFRMVASAC